MSNITANDLIYKALELIELQIKLSPSSVSFKETEQEAISINIAKIINIMDQSGDSHTYNVNQAASVGPNPSASNNIFYQNNYTFPNDFNYVALADELSRLQTAMKEKAVNAEDFTAVAEVVNAQSALKLNDKPKIVTHLLNAGKFALETAKEIGVGVVAEIIVKALGV